MVGAFFLAIKSGQLSTGNRERFQYKRFSRFETTKFQEFCTAEDAEISS
jgi:hypothetical protein